jgi:diadenosine tetraphosphate (Ap4A) HIT family hydrolase
LQRFVSAAFVIIRTMPCVFCDSPPADPLYADDRCFVVLHEDRAVRGHALVVWRAHVENLSDLADADAQHLLSVYNRAERALLAVTRAERAVILKLGIQTPHLHLHIYPVSASLDRPAVQAILDAKTRETVEDDFAERVRAAISA